MSNTTSRIIIDGKYVDLFTTHHIMIFNLYLSQ